MPFLYWIVCFLQALRCVKWQVKIYLMKVWGSYINTKSGFEKTHCHRMHRNQASKALRQPSASLRQNHSWYLIYLESHTFTPWKKAGGKEGEGLFEETNVLWIAKAVLQNPIGYMSPAIYWKGQRVLAEHTKALWIKTSHDARSSCLPLKCFWAAGAILGIASTAAPCINWRGFSLMFLRMWPFPTNRVSHPQEAA